ncbi:MAG: ATP synthase F1 subunit delta [Patescibacteria group bacterium]|nr:ATP synthase F1 subunit delta [Patescibacteria group bacterium]
MANSKRNNKEIAGTCIQTANAENLVARVIDDMRLFQDVLALNPALVQLLQDGLMPIQKRLEALDKTVGKQIHEYSRNTIALLIQNNSLNDFKTFLQTLETVARESANHFECTVITAVEVSDDVKNQIQKALEKKFKGTVRIQSEIDPSIVGGLVVRCGDWKYQSTIQSKLQQLHNHLVYSE